MKANTNKAGGKKTFLQTVVTKAKENSTQLKLGGNVLAFFTGTLCLRSAVLPLRGERLIEH